MSRNQWVVAIYAAVITFLTYATVYGFRKTYTAGTYDGMTVWGMGYKEVLVIIQAIGYLCSKFYGIRFIAGLKRFGRWKIILVLVLVSWMAWLLFAIIPPPINIIFLFFNGFPLGLLWGIIFSYIEGRRATDFIGAAMAVSFIFSSGLVKSIGLYLKIRWHLTDIWMPFIAGAVFLPFLLLFVFLLEKIPPPTGDDVLARTERIPMTKEQRAYFLRTFFPGMVILVILYVFLTIFRDIRDNFIADMWKEMGYFNQPGLFTKTEVPITMTALLVVGSMILIKKNFRALMITHGIVMAGFVIAGLSTLLFVNGLLNPVLWVTFVGLGLYMGYIPYNCVLFERLIATFRIAGNVGFLIYIADAFGYLGSVGVIMTKAILVALHFKVQWTPLYSSGVMVLSVLGVIGTLISMRYFSRKFKRMNQS